MTRTIAVQIGADTDACIAEAPHNEHPPSLIVHSGRTELVVTLGADATVEACDPHRRGTGGLAGQPGRDEPTMTTPTPGVGFPKKGTLLTLPPGTWLYGEGTLRLRVNRVMTEISKYEDDMVWIEGTRIDNERRPSWIQVLVRVDALPRPRGTSPVNSGSACQSKTRGHRGGRVRPGRSWRCRVRRRLCPGRRWR